jgi:membrane-bound lytic murein transglycosylase B
LPARRAQRQERAAVHPQRAQLDQAFPWIAEAALKNREQQFTIDGEAVVLGVGGVSDFNALHSRRYEDEVELFACSAARICGRCR